MLVAFLTLVVAGTAATAGTSAPRRSDASVRTLATTPYRVAGFAQSRDYIAWSGGPNVRKCAVVMHHIRSGQRTRLSHDCQDPLGALVLAGRRAFWEEGGASNLSEYSYLWTASVGNPRPASVAYQSVGNEGFDHLVAAASDGRSAYFWTSPEDLTPGPLARFDGPRRRRLTRTLPRLQALAAGESRFA